MTAASSLTFRPVMLADAPALHRLCWQAAAPDDVTRRVQSVVARAEQGRAWGLVVLRDGEIVGYGQLNRWDQLGEISDLFVAPDQRGQGLGTALIQRLIGLAREMLMEEVEIGAAESNPRALSLYRRLGFRDARHTRLDVGRGPEPVIYLRLNLRRTVCE